MKTADDYLWGWADKYERSPNLNQQEAAAVNLLAAVLLVMAILQIVSFNSFKDALNGVGLTSGPATWAVVLIVLEVWAVAGLVKLPVPGLIRFFGNVFAVLVAGFWFLANLQAVSAAKELTNSGFFGKYLNQTPGWWTVIEASALLFWTVYVVSLSKNNR